MEIIRIAMEILTALVMSAVIYLGVSYKRLEKAHVCHKAEIDMLERHSSDLILAYTELEKRVIALEHFNESEGKEIMETLQEQNKQEKLFSQGMENIINFGPQTARKG